MLLSKEGVSQLLLHLLMLVKCLQRANLIGIIYEPCVSGQSKKEKNLKFTVQKKLAILEVNLL